MVSCMRMTASHVPAGSGEWRMGWQSIPAAHVPDMAVLSCPLPSGAAQLDTRHRPASEAGEPHAKHLFSAGQRQSAPADLSICTAALPFTMMLLRSAMPLDPVRENGSCHYYSFNDIGCLQRWPRAAALLRWGRRWELCRPCTS